MSQLTSRISSIPQLAVAAQDARNARGWTQEELSQLTGISRAWINRFERGRIPDPGFAKLLTICAALGIEITASYQPGAQPLPHGNRPRQGRKGAPTQPAADSSAHIQPQTVLDAASLIEAITQQALKERRQP